MLSVPHKCGKARALLCLNVLVGCKIHGFCVQSLRPVVPLLFLCCVLLEKYISNNEFLDNWFSSFIFLLFTLLVAYQVQLPLLIHSRFERSFKNKNKIPALLLDWMMWCSEAVSLERPGYALINKNFLWHWIRMAGAFFFQTVSSDFLTFDSGSRKEEGVGKLIIFHLQRIQLWGRNFLIHWFQDNRMSRSMPDVRFSLWRWEEEMGLYWSLHATTDWEGIELRGL